jgi:hypothetical protein
MNFKNLKFRLTFKSLILLKFKKLKILLKMNLKKFKLTFKSLISPKTKELTIFLKMNLKTKTNF